MKVNFKRTRNPFRVLRVIRVIRDSDKKNISPQETHKHAEEIRRNTQAIRKTPQANKPDGTKAKETNIKPIQRGHLKVLSD